VTCPAFTKDTENNVQVAGKDESNYQFWSRVTLGETQVVKAKTDLTFNWSTLNKDMFGETIDPKTDVGNLGMIILPLSKDELQAKINADSLDIADRAAAATYLTGGTMDRASTVQFDLLGQPINHDVLLGQLDEVAYPQSDYTYMIMVGSGNQYGKNGRMLATFHPSASASATEVTIGPNSTTCDYGATLDKLKPVVIPKGTANIIFDWGALTKNAAGRLAPDEVDFYEITRVMVASFTQSVAELQKKENFLNMEKLAVAKWSTTELSGVSVKFSALTNEKDQSAFTGIDSTHTWIIALVNQSALNPAPWYITVLQPCQ
jgi:hypothetical protein